MSADVTVRVQVRVNAWDVDAMVEYANCGRKVREMGEMKELEL